MKTRGTDMKCRVFSIEIVEGAIFHEFFAETRSVKEFLSEFHIIETFPVKGWSFEKVYLTHGTQENGCGWALVKKDQS